MKYQHQKNKAFSEQPVYRNDPQAKVDFAVGDMIKTTKEGVGEVEGEVVAINGQQLSCRWEHGSFYAWTWQSKKVQS